MVRQLIVANNIVVDHRVSFGSEIPWLLLGVVRPILKTCKLVFKVYYVVSLLISQGPIFVLGQDVDEGVLLRVSSGFFRLGIRVNLGDRIVTRLLGLDVCVCHLDVWVRLPLKVGLGFNVCINLFFPVAIVSFPREEHLV